MHKKPKFLFKLK